MKQNKLQLNYKKSLFCYILAISLIPIFLLGMYSYKTYVNGLTTNVKVSTNATVNQVKGKVDNILSNIRKSYIEIADDNTVNWLLNSEIKYSDYTYLVEAGNSLSGPTYYSEYIDGFTFINYKTGWVYSNRGLFKYDKVINKEEVEEIFRLNECYLIRSFWISNLTEDTSTLKRETVNLRNLSLVLKLPSIHKHPYAMLVVNISMSGLQKELRKDLGDNDITVIDMDGNLIFTTNKDVASSCINIQKNTSSVKKKLSEIKSLKTEDGKQYSISVKDSNVMNWYYIISYDKGLISSSGEPILSYTFLLLGITCIIVLIALIFTHRLYMPILKLSQYVTRMLPNKDNDIMRNEFEYITQKFDKLSDNKALLESIIASQQPQ